MANSTKLRNRRQRPLLKTVIFRADSSAKIGGGHVYRCLAFAELLKQRRIRSEFIVKGYPGNMAKHLKTLGFKTHVLPAKADISADAKKCLKIIGQRKFVGMAVDNYALSAKWERVISNRVPLIAIDDFPDRDHSCHMLINTGLFSPAEYKFKLDPSRETICLLGPQFSILRKEFRSKSKSVSRSGVCTFFGAYDGSGETLRFLQAIQKANSNLKFNVIISRSNKNLKLIQKLKLSKNIKLHIEPKFLSKIMRSSKMYFGSGGTITSERSLCGLTGFVVAVADNQLPLACNLHKAGAQIFLGNARSVSYEKSISLCESLLHDPRRLQKMEQTASAMFGALKVEDVEPVENTLTLRDAEKSDSKFLYNLRREKSVAEASIQKGKFSYKSHVSWLKKVLSGRQTRLFVVMYRGESCGQVRIDSDLKVSISLSAKVRGLGLSSRALEMALKTHRSERVSRVKHYTALIRPGNAASVKTFQRVGFRKLGMLVHANGERFLEFGFVI